MNQLAKPSSLVLLVGSALVRLLPHPSNFTPVGATALFGGARLARPLNYILPLCLLFVTDIFLGFHNTMPYVYGSFLLTSFLGEAFLKDRPGTLKVASIGLLSSFLFFLITNFGVWTEGLLYPKTFAGLMQSYVMGLPFLKNMLFADLIFSVGFFKAYQWAEQRQVVATFDKKVVTWLR